MSKRYYGCPKWFEPFVQPLLVATAFGWWIASALEPSPVRIGVAITLTVLAVIPEPEERND